MAPTTDPGWTPLFMTTAGLVTKTGSPVAHGPTVAREYGIPAVICVRNAAQHIKTGQLITIDGAAGTVRVTQAPRVSMTEPASGSPPLRTPTTPARPARDSSRPPPAVSLKQADPATSGTVPPTGADRAASYARMPSSAPTLRGGSSERVRERTARHHDRPGWRAACARTFNG